MLLALAMHNAEAVLIQLYVQYAYDIEAVEIGDLSKMADPDFFANAKKGFATIGTCINLTIVGVLIIKLNFLIFFRRLGAKAQKIITILWWAVLTFTVAGAIAQIGMQQFGCFFGSIEYIFGGACTNKSEQRIFFNAIFSSAVDAISDFLSQSFSLVPLPRRLDLVRYCCPQATLTSCHIHLADPNHTGSHCVTCGNFVEKPHQYAKEAGPYVHLQLSIPHHSYHDC